MKKDSKFFKYFILTNPGSLSMNERIILILIPSIFIFCCVASMYYASHDLIVWILLLGVYVFFAGLALPLIFFEKYDEKYGFNSKIRFGGTYQFISKNFSLILPGLVIIILTVGFILNDFFKSLLISFAFIIPFLALFFRIDVFNDNSSIENDEIILGYNPGYYGLLSLGLGIYGYINVNNLFNSNSNMAIILFILTIIFQTLLLIPDKLNNVLFFEIRRKEGFLAYICLVIICYAMFCFIILGGNLFNGITIDLSFEGIIRKVITYGTAIILAILFLKQIKKMNDP